MQGLPSLGAERLPHPVLNAAKKGRKEGRKGGRKGREHNAPSFSASTFHHSFRGLRVTNVGSVDTLYSPNLEEEEGENGRSDDGRKEDVSISLPDIPTTTTDVASIILPRTCREGRNFEVCDCRRRRRRSLVMNLTSRLEFISVTRRGALALDWGEGGRPPSPPPLALSPSVPKTGPPISRLL